MLKLTGVLLGVRTFAAHDGMPANSMGNLEGVTIMLRPDQVASVQNLEGSEVTVTGFAQTNKYGTSILAQTVIPVGAVLTKG